MAMVLAVSWVSECDNLHQFEDDEAINVILGALHHGAGNFGVSSAKRKDNAVGILIK